MKHWIEVEITPRRSRREMPTDEVAVAVEEQLLQAYGQSYTIRVRPAVERVTSRVPSGYISMDECRSLAETYHGGEGRHPLARHRDSMG
jgi:hypothetical protein